MPPAKYLNGEPDYVLITPARNEAEYIEETLRAVAGQTIKPKKWVIVSDGSTDETDRLVERYVKRYEFIELLRRDGDKRRSFDSKVHAIRNGVDRLREVDYEFIGNLDADISFGSDYFERIMQRMYERPELGIGGGHQLEWLRGTWVPQTISFDWSVTGGVQFFRRRCFEAIGGYLPADGSEDAVAEVMARQRGWQVRTFRDIKVRHHRVMGTEGRGLFAVRFCQGRKDHAQGAHPSFEMAKCLGRMSEPPRLIGSIVRLFGFFWATLRREPLALPPEIARALRREQQSRMRTALFELLTRNPWTDQDGTNREA